MFKSVETLYKLLLCKADDMISSYYKGSQGDFVEKAEVMCSIYLYMRNHSFINAGGIPDDSEFMKMAQFPKDHFGENCYAFNMSLYDFVTTLLYNITPRETPFLRTLGIMAIAMEDGEDCVHSLLFKCSHLSINLLASETLYEHALTSEFVSEFTKAYCNLIDEIQSQETNLFS